MNKLFIIGNLTKDPEMRTLQSGDKMCSFTVAVNRRVKGEDKPDFFNVTAFRQTAENCVKYLAKGRKVAVTGPVSVRTYTGGDGNVRASLDVTASEVEFLSPKGEQDYQKTEKTAPVMQAVEMSDEDLPF